MKIVIVGCGTTGNHIIPLIKEHELLVLDRDIVEEKNLARQPLFGKGDIGKAKAEVVGKKGKMNYKVLDLDYTNISLLDADLVIDCTDNLETRFLINEYCMQHKIPWIYTGIVGERTRMMAITGEFCFRCLFSEIKGLDTCTTAGVNLGNAKILGDLVYEETQRVAKGEKSRGLWANGEWFKVEKNPNCPVCKGVYSYLNGKKERMIKFCGSSRYQFKGNFDYEQVKKRFHGKGDSFVYEDFYIFKERVLVKAETEKEAKKKFAEIIGT